MTTKTSKRELHTLDELIARLTSATGLDNHVVQGLDLRALTADDGQRLLNATLCGTVLLGCELTPEQREHAHARRALVFPRLPDLPYHSYRPALYTAAELMEGYVHGKPETLHDTRDQVVYRHYDAIRKGGTIIPILDALAQRLHDHAIDDALDELLHPAGAPARQVVAIMGGHSMRRDAPAYRVVCQIARTLTRSGKLMASGGGPGAMEACMLGAYLAGHDDSALDVCLELLAPAPTYKDERWLDAAFDVCARFDMRGEGLAIPTWFYGHEPPNIFASHIAKYFSNSIREDGLLAIAKDGVLFAPGSAGTIQEVFQDACQNHYNTFGVVSPMVFLDTAYWTETKPVYPLLAELSRDREYGKLLAIVDTVDDAVEALQKR